MSLKFNHTVIYSKNKEKLSSYLSELLEASIHRIEEEIEIRTKDFHLVICDESDESGIRDDFKSAFHFHISSKKELDEMLKKVQFIRFRQGRNNELPTIEEKIMHGKIRYFFKLQEDGHEWFFSTSKENKNE